LYLSNTWCYSNERTAPVALQVSSDITAGSMRPFYATNSNCERESHEKAATLMKIASFGSFCVGPCKFVLVPFFFSFPECLISWVDLWIQLLHPLHQHYHGYRISTYNSRPVQAGFSRSTPLLFPSRPEGIISDNNIGFQLDNRKTS
jgi:hypothetical protein